MHGDGALLAGRDRSFDRRGPVAIPPRRDDEVARDDGHVRRGRGAERASVPDEVGIGRVRLQRHERHLRALDLPVSLEDLAGGARRIRRVGGIGRHEKREIRIRFGVLPLEQVALGPIVERAGERCPRFGVETIDIGSERIDGVRESRARLREPTRALPLEEDLAPVLELLQGEDRLLAKPRRFVLRRRRRGRGGGRGCRCGRGCGRRWGGNRRRAWSLRIARPGHRRAGPGRWRGRRRRLRARVHRRSHQPRQYQHEHRRERAARHHGASHRNLSTRPRRLSAT